MADWWADPAFWTALLVPSGIGAALLGTAWRHALRHKDLESLPQDLKDLKAAISDVRLQVGVLVLKERSATRSSVRTWTG